MRRALAFAVLGIVAYLAFLLAAMPASYVATRVQLPPGVVLHDPAGTLWQGSARATLTGAGMPVTLDRIAWRFAPAALLGGEMAFDLTAQGPGVSAQARVGHGPNGFSASGAQAQADAALVEALVPLARTWRPQGTVTLDAPRLAWREGGEVKGEARAEWKAAQVAMPAPRRLGSYRLELRGDGGPAKLTLSTLEGDVQLAGRGELAPPRFELRGEARAQGSDAAALAPLLDLLGPRRADGAREFRWHAP